MNNTKLKKNWIHYLWLFILIYPIFSLNTGFPALGNIIFILMFAIAIGGYKYISISQKHCSKTLHRQYTSLYYYNILLFLIGFLFIPNPLYFKFYISFFINLLLFSIYYYFNAKPLNAIDFIQKLTKYVLPLYLIVLILANTTNSIKYNIYYLTLFSVLYIFVPSKNKISILLLVILTFLTIILNTDYRALIVLNMIGGFIFVLRFIKVPINLIKILTYIFILLPIFIIILSVCTGWNPFTILDSSSAESFSLAGEKIVMSGDSRSFLYKEIYNHLCKYNALLWGTTPGIGYESVLMNVDDDFYNFLKDGRLLTEVGILEFFHFGGFINTILVLMIFLSAIQMIFKYAHSRLAHLAALYISFRWFFLFMEGDITMSVQWLGLFVVLGFFTNKEILTLTDKQLNIIFNRYF